jgi:ketosteroid isomerase-like protein
MAEEGTTPDLEELARLLADAYSRLDFDALLTPLAPDAIWDTTPMGVGLFQGHEAIRGVYEDLVAPYEDVEIVWEELRDLGNGVTFTVQLSRGRPRGSSRFLEARYAIVSTWANGLTDRITWYSDIDEARATAERLAEERR